MSTKNRFQVEIMGVTAATATKVDGLEAIKHTPAKIKVGNRPNDILARGTYEVGEVTVNHAEALGQAGAELYEKLRSYAKGERVEAFDARVMLMSEDGSTPMKSYECLGCVPTSFKNDGMDASSNDFAMFTFAFLPEDVIVL